MPPSQYTQLFAEKLEWHFSAKGTPIVTEATDAALFARALEWAFNEKNAQNQTFTITNGDVLIWHHLWPEIASYFDVPLGQNEIEHCRQHYRSLKRNGALLLKNIS